VGILLAFAGIVVAFGDGMASGRGTLLGDFFGVLAAVFWALLTLVLRGTRLATASASKALFYQHAVTAPLLLCAAWLIGEPGIVALTLPVMAAFAYQCLVVAFASMLVWLWLLRRYLAARLSVLSSLTPLFGVLGGALFLGEPVSGVFLLAAVLVVAGIWLVNRRR
jgi:drug/metabolite transporter (DMT)-like permease